MRASDRDRLMLEADHLPDPHKVPRIQGAGMVPEGRMGMLGRSMLRPYVLALWRRNSPFP